MNWRLSMMTDMVTVNIPMDALVEAIRQNGIGTRVREMVDKHG